MNRKDTEHSTVTLYWWNGPTKTLDFKGNPIDFLREKGLKSIRLVKHPKVKGIKGYRFKMWFGGNIMTIDMFDIDFANNIGLLIKLYLSYLGDKAVFYDHYHREHKINWG